MSSAGQILSVAAPIALTFALPGIGTAMGMDLSAAGIGASLGASAGTVGASALGGAAIGAGTGAITSALTGKNILKGAAIGGVTAGITSGAGAYINQAGGLSNALGMGSSATDASGAAAAGASGLQTAAGADYNAIANGASGFGSALSSAAPAATSAASSGIGSYIPSVLGGTGANPSALSVLGLGANLYSGIQGTAAAKANAAAMQNANNQALALQAKNYSATTTNLAPYLTTGNQANSQLQTDLGIGSNSGAAGYGSLTAPFTAADLENTPGYQFQLQQGTQALQRQQAASGDQFSGAAIKEGQQFATGLADSTYNTAYQQYLANNQQKYGMLAGAAGSGQNAAVNQGGFAAGNSNLGTNTLQNTGNITAAGNNAGNTAVNNSLAGALYGGVGGSSLGIGGALGSSYGGASTGMTPLAGGGYTMNGMTYNAQGVRIA
jgi:hypothetical protein